jgi:hypothetical protein
MLIGFFPGLVKCRKRGLRISRERFLEEMWMITRSRNLTSHGAGALYTATITTDISLQQQ